MRGDLLSARLEAPRTGGIVAAVRWLVILALMATLAGCGSADGTPSPEGTTARATAAIPVDVVCQWARVRSVTDGDTVRVDFEAGAANQPVRYIGIDAPETVKPDTPVQPFGPEASRENARLVAGKRICLEKDVSERDRYDRLLRFAWLPDGTLVNEALVRAGLATLDTFPPDVKYVERLAAAQTAAREARRGMWAPAP